MIIVTANERGTRGSGDLSEAEEPDTGDLAGEQTAGGDARQEHFDDPTRLLLDDAAEHHGPIGGDGHEEQHGHDERRGLVVRTTTRHVTELDIGDLNWSEQLRHLVRADPRVRCAVLDGHDLDGAGHDCFELLVGSALPFKLATIDDEHVGLAVAHGLFAVGPCGVAVDADVCCDRVGLRLDRGW